MVCDVLGEKNNGTTLAAWNLIDHLKSRGHEVGVVCCDQAKKGVDGFYVAPALNLGKLLNKIVEANGVTLAKADDEILERAISTADVVHLLIPFALARRALTIAKRLGKPVTASFHCQAENVTAHVFLMNCGFANKLVYKNFYKSVFSRCDVVHYPTEFIRDLFEKETGKTNSVVISNGVNKTFFAEREGVRISDKFTIVCSGRYSKEKAQSLLIKAVAESGIKDKIKVAFAGDGPYKNSLKKLAAKLGVDAEFRFFGRDELIDMLRGADLYVHTATIEIEAIACLEAIVCGLVPVINNSPRSATKGFALDANNLFKNGDYKDLAKKIRFWFENASLKEEYKSRYKSIISAFDQENCMIEMEKMLARAVEIGGEQGVDK